MEKKVLITLQEKTSALIAKGNYKEAIEACLHLLDWGIKLNDYKSILFAHFHNATSYYYIGRIEESYRSIEAHKELCDKYGDQADELNAYDISFLLYDCYKEFDRAEENLQKSIQLSKALKNYSIASNAYNNYSYLLLTKGIYIEAEKMAEMGLAMAQLHKSANEIGELRVNLNRIHACIGLGKLTIAKTLLFEIEHHALLESFPREKAKSYYLQGIWYSKKSLYKEAHESFVYAKELAESCNDICLLRDIQQQRCELCELTKDVEAGYLIQKEYIALLNEINERKLMFMALKISEEHSIAAITKQANTDFLTGLFNRNYIEKNTNNWLMQAYKVNERITCLVLDIDHFKEINDVYGHLFGDEVMKQVSKACAGMIDEDDLIGRFGGDEFVVILKDAALEAGVTKAEELLELVRNLKIYKEDKLIPITVSVGVTDSLVSNATHFKELFHLADLGLYKAKRNGKDQIGVV